MTGRPRVLCLDDEPYVLDGLRRNLRTEFQVTTTTEPREALELLAEEDDGPYAVFVSDMRMPQMNGVDVLRKAQATAPETTRVLLTGDADVQVAVSAINEGGVFRFILKPCPPDPLRATVSAAAEQHRLVRAERELLQDTLKGCVEALMDTLAMAQPGLFSRAGRLRRLVAQLWADLDLPDAWQVEMAAQLGDIGAITLPPTVVTALQTGLPGNRQEADMLAQLPKLADSMLAKIPRLEDVREIVRAQMPTDRDPATPLPPSAPQAARLLQVVREYDALVHRDTPADLALSTLAFRNTHADEHLAALAKVVGMQLPRDAVREVTIDQLRIGHELADDLYTTKGLLLVSRGQVITERLLIRVQNFEATTGLRGRILVFDA
jgi:response regulator RpfG family c-di-GMP phosphodiesterase